ERNHPEERKDEDLGGDDIRFEGRPCRDGEREQGLERSGCGERRPRVLFFGSDESSAEGDVDDNERGEGCPGAPAPDAVIHRRDRYAHDEDGRHEGEVPPFRTGHETTLSYFSFIGRAVRRRLR